MNSTFLEQLLYEDESATLDFKREQYRFVKASDEDKSELLKDILGFANGWRRSDGYILIGVGEVTGGRSNVVGIIDHLNDHSLQQFVNNLTNRPVQFGYETCNVGDKQIGIIRIEQQNRPIYLKRDFGKLKRGEVYVRRGSSTDPTNPATPEEIAQMGRASNGSASQAELSIEFADPEQDDAIGTQIAWTAESCRMPDANDIPILEDRPASFRLLGGQTVSIPVVSCFNIDGFVNSNYYREFAEFELFRRLVKRVRLVIANTGDVAALDVRLEFCIQNGSGFGILDESDIPEVPKRRLSFVASSLKNLNFRHRIENAGDVDIERNDHRTKVEIVCGNLQPGRRVWTEPFHLGIGQSGEIRLTGQLYASNLAKPQQFSLTVNANIANTSLTVEELIELAESAGENEHDKD